MSQEKVLQIRGHRPRICNVFEIHFSWTLYISWKNLNSPIFSIKFFWTCCSFNGRISFVKGTNGKLRLPKFIERNKERKTFGSAPAKRRATLGFLARKCEDEQIRSFNLSEKLLTRKKKGKQNVFHALNTKVELN